MQKAFAAARVSSNPLVPAVWPIAEKKEESQQKAAVDTSRMP
jgi:hypothetical protein